MTIEVGDVLFLDTNVLLTATDESRLQHSAARRAISEANMNGIHFGLSGQILREYLTVATRPIAANGLGLSVGDALENCAQFSKRALFYDETEEVAFRLRELIAVSGMHGKQIHDVNVVATMLTHGLRKLLTANVKDFESFTDIEVVTLDAFTT